MQVIASEIRARQGNGCHAPWRSETSSYGAELVERLVARSHKVALSALRAPGRPTADVLWARRSAMYLQRVVLELNCDEIARRFGHHRTSVVHACRKVEDRRDEARFDRRLQRLEDRIAETLAGAGR